MGTEGNRWRRLAWGKSVGALLGHAYSTTTKGKVVIDPYIYKIEHHETRTSPLITFQVIYLPAKIVGTGDLPPSRRVRTGAYGAMCVRKYTKVENVEWETGYPEWHLPNYVGTGKLLPSGLLDINDRRLVFTVSANFYFEDYNENTGKKEGVGSWPGTVVDTYHIVRQSGVWTMTYEEKPQGLNYEDDYVHCAEGFLRLGTQNTGGESIIVEVNDADFPEGIDIPKTS